MNLRKKIGALLLTGAMAVSIHPRRIVITMLQNQLIRQDGILVFQGGI